VRAGRVRILPSDPQPPSFRYPVSDPNLYNTVAAAAATAAVAAVAAAADGPAD